MNDSYSIIQFIMNFADNHPSFQFNINFHHHCDPLINEGIVNDESEVMQSHAPSNIDIVTESQLETNNQQTRFETDNPSNIYEFSGYGGSEFISDNFSGLYSKDSSNKRSFMQRTFKNIQNAITTFGDDLISNPVNERDADIHYVWWNQNIFYPNITNFAKFFFVVLNYNKEWRNFGRLWRFKLKLDVKDTTKRLELKGVIFNWDDKYSVFSNSIVYDEETCEKKTYWFNFDPSLSSIATRVTKSHFVDGHLEVKEIDYESNAYPCLLFYSIEQ